MLAVTNRVKKGITLQQVIDAVKYCKDAGIKTKGYFMIGMPGDTTETMQDRLNLAIELKLNDAMFGITTPFPGTELWDKIDKNKIGPLSDAFYFVGDGDNYSDFHIFYNLSDASNEDIIKTMKKAQNISNIIRTKTSCEELFGRKLGYFAWQFSKIDILRKYGKMVLFAEKNKHEKK